MGRPLGLERPYTCNKCGTKHNMTVCDIRWFTRPTNHYHDGKWVGYGDNERVLQKMLSCRNPDCGYSEWYDV